MGRLALLLLGLALLAAGCGGGGGGATELCGWRDSPPRTYDHVVWIWMENHAYEQIVGPVGSDAYVDSPYVNGTLAGGCGLATSYRNVTQPSLPNYIAATSGGINGVEDDCKPADCPVAVESLFEQVAKAGKTWRSFMDNMPKNCLTEDDEAYVVTHNPAVYYTRIHHQCTQWDVSLGIFNADLDRETLPSFSFIVPDLCHDGHSCPTRTGDRWLGDLIGRLADSKPYRSGRTVIFVTWDEGADGPAGEDCTTGPLRPDCHVATLVVSPYTRPGTRSAEEFSHYSLLRTTEELLGIQEHLGRAAEARSMRSAFGL